MLVPRTPLADEALLDDRGSDGVAWKLRPKRRQTTSPGSSAVPTRKFSSARTVLDVGFLEEVTPGVKGAQETTGKGGQKTLRTPFTDARSKVLKIPWASGCGLWVSGNPKAASLAEKGCSQVVVSTRLN